MQIFYSDDDRTDRKRLASILTAFALSFIFNLLSAKCIYFYYISECVVKLGFLLVQFFTVGVSSQCIKLSSRGDVCASSIAIKALSFYDCVLKTFCEFSRISVKKNVLPKYWIVSSLPICSGMS